MPAVKASAKEQNDRVFRSVLAKYQALENFNDEQVAKRLSICRYSYQQKKRNPDQFTRGEVAAFCKIFRVSNEDKLLLI